MIAWPTWRKVFAVAVALGAGGPKASAEISGSISLLSDYRLRGVSQSDGRIAPQVELDWNGSDDWSAGFIASKVDFKDHEGTSVETDGFIDRHLDFDQTGLDFSLFYYGYPDHRRPTGSPRYSMLEISAKLAREWRHLSVSAMVAWSPEFFGETGAAWDVEAVASYPLNEWLTASGHLGRQWIGAWDRLSGSGVPYDYGDIGLTASHGSFSLDVRYEDTSLSRSECLVSQGGANWCAPTFIVTFRYAVASATDP